MVTAYKLARSDTNTSVAYWMSVPMRNLARWIEVIAEAQAQDKKG